MARVGELRESPRCRRTGSGRAHARRERGAAVALRAGCGARGRADQGRRGLPEGGACPRGARPRRPGYHQPGAVFGALREDVPRLLLRRKSPPNSPNSAPPVVVTQRRQRYVLPKFAAGVPSDSRIFTRYGTLANETLPASRDRPPTQGDRRRSRWQSGAIRRAGARPVAVRRRCHPGPAVPAAGGGGPNHGAAVDDISRRHDA